MDYSHKSSSALLSKPNTTIITYFLILFCGLFPQVILSTPFKTQHNYHHLFFNSTTSAFPLPYLTPATPSLFPCIYIFPSFLASWNSALSMSPPTNNGHQLSSFLILHKPLFAFHSFYLYSMPPLAAHSTNQIYHHIANHACALHHERLLLFIR